MKPADRFFKLSRPTKSRKQTHQLPKPHRPISKRRQKSKPDSKQEKKSPNKKVPRYPPNFQQLRLERAISRKNSQEFCLKPTIEKISGIESQLKNFESARRKSLTRESSKIGSYEDRHESLINLTRRASSILS